MLEQTGNAITFYAQFIVSGAAGTGLTITCTVYKGSDGTAIVTAQSATEIGGGVYKYTLASGSVPAEDDLVAVFNEAAATADQTDVPSMWSVGKAGIENLDASIQTADTAIDSAVTAIGALDTKHDATDAALAVVDGNVDDVETLLNTVDGKVDLQATAVALAALDTKHDATDVALAVVDGNVDDIETAVAAIPTTDPLLAAVPGSYAQNTAGWALGQIGSAVITVTTPLAVDGSTLSLVRGDDYLVAEGRALTFTSTGWEDLTSADPIELTIRRRAEAFGSGSDPVIFTVEDHVASRSVGGATQSITFEFPAASTNNLLPGTSTGKYDIQATLASGAIVTLLTGVVSVTEDQTRPA
jgi:hypothetical protein